jgi:hypothetical protein
VTEPEYWKFYWQIASFEYPSVLFCEVRDDWVTRAVELYDTGELRWCDGPDERGGARFPDQPWSERDDPLPPELFQMPLTRDYFERIWGAATQER